MSELSFAVIIPTYNGGETAKKLFASICRQTLQPKYVLVIDSTSQDQTQEVARSFGFQVRQIAAAEFNHGGTRRWAAELCQDVEFLVYLTQDALLADATAFTNLLAAFTNERVGAAYGRQLPKATSGPLGSHARLFNYGPVSRVKSLADAPQLGIKTAFISNSFAAYRQKALSLIGSFPEHVILGEDTFVAANLLLADWKVAYVAEARVFHSHDYSFDEEFQRYFDIGVFHAREAWIRQAFGQAEGEGKRFVLSELRYLWKTGHGGLFFTACLRTLGKFLGYRLGMNEAYLPAWLKVKFSMYKGYWNRS